MSVGTAPAISTDSQIQGSILYVKPGANGTCSSWADACELQTALFNVVAGDLIWVAAGTYKPTTDTNREATFQLKSGVAIYGGFPVNGGDWETRDWETNVTTLSGDIGVIGDNVDNSCKVVTSIGVDNATVLDGFTIIGGNANEASLYLTEGGGMYNISGNPTLTNIIFTNNVAKYDGGGMYNIDSSPNLRNVTFSNNSADYFGGGMYNYLGSPSLTNVTFSGNSSTNDAGGMYNSSSNPSLTNVTFKGNIAYDSGGGMLNYHSSPSLSNVTFSGNSALLGGGMYNNNDSHPSLTNSILWGNSPDQIVGGQLNSATYNDIQGGYPGTGNINQDPLLGPLANNGGLTQTHALGAESPAIDAGDPKVCSAEDQRGFFRPIDGDGDGLAICDMGAYEYGSAGPGISLFLPLIQK